MKTLIINQDKQTQRMAFQSNQLQSLEIDFQRVSAFELTGKDDQIYKKHFDTWQRPLSVTEVSCFFSHQKAWNIIVAENQPMLILEDDAWLDSDTSSVLKVLSKLVDVDYVTLEVVRLNKKKLIAKKNTDSFCGVNLFRLYQGRSGAAGYVLWPSGARKLLSLTKENNIGLADKFIGSCYSLKAYQIEPGLVIQLDQCAFHGITPPLEVKSTITKKIETSLSFTDYLRYKSRRIFGEVKTGINLLMHYPHAERRYIVLSNKFKNRP